MAFRFVHAPPLWGWILGAVAIVLLALAVYRHARSVLPPSRWLALVALRIVAFVIVALVFLQPVRMVPAPAATGRTVALVVDDSRSMRLPDAQGVASRVERARQLVAGRLRPMLTDDFELRVFAADETVREVPSEEALTGDGRASDLGGAVAALAERGAAGEFVGLVLISDGAASSPLPTGLGALPVFAIGVGTSGTVIDREVRDVTVSDVSVVDSFADVSATIVGHGPAEQVDVRLLENGRPIDVRSVRLPGQGQQVRQHFRVSPSRTAATVYTVEVAASSAELTPENNRASVFVPQPGAPYPVLLFEGAPGFEHSFLSRTLERDPGLDIDVVVRKGRTESGAPTYYVQGAASRTGALVDGFPRTKAELFRYAAVVLGNVDGDHLSREQIAMLVDFVEERGGGLAVLGGRSFGEGGILATDLGRVLGVEAQGSGAVNAAAAASSRQGTRVTLTPAGQQHPIMRVAPVPGREAPWEGLPSLAAASAVGRTRRGAEILATVSGPAGEEQPLVAVQRAGRGRSFVFTGEGAWRWRMGLPSTDRLYETFWRQAVRWLAAQAPPPVDVAMPALAIGASTPVLIRVVDETYQPVTDANVQVTLEEPGGTTRPLAATLDPGQPGVWRTSVLTLASGVHRIDVDATRGGRPLGRGRVQVLAGGSDPEFLDPRRHDGVLRRIAEATGGALLEADELDGLGDRIRRAAAAPTARLVEQDVWHNGWSFLIICAVLATEWALRRRWGLR